MVTFRHVLCPIDFSDMSARALTYAAAFAARYAAPLTVLHVAPRFNEVVRPGDSGPVPHPGSRADLLAKVDRSIAHAGAAALDVRPLVLAGGAAERIVGCAAEMRADLLVLGTHGTGGFHRLLLGSVTEKVVRTATCPVLTVPPSAPAMTSGSLVFEKILCPIDYSPSALSALHYALDLARQAGGCITVLSALEYLEPEEPCEHVDSDIRTRRQHFIDHARERLHDQLAGEPRTACVIEEVVALNRVYKEVLQRAAAAKVDLIVMGTHGTGGIELMLYGSNTQHVVRAATCPVLTVRA